MNSQEQPSPQLWAANIEDEQAGESLGLNVEAVQHFVLKEDKGDTAAISERGQSIVKLETLKVLSRVGDVADNEFIRRADDFMENGHNISYEIETVSELIDIALPDNASPTMRSYYNTYAGSILPYMKNEQIPGAHLLIRNGKLTHKAKAAIPQLMDIIHGIDVEDAEDAKAKFENVIDVIIDPSSSEEEIRALNQRTKRFPPFEVFEFVQGQDSVLLIKVDSQTRNYIQNRLGSKADWHLGHAWPSSPSKI